MDRDRRWDRVKPPDVMTQDGPGDGRSVIEVLQDSYAEKVTDRFVIPIRIAPNSRPGWGDIF